MKKGNLLEKTIWQWKVIEYIAYVVVILTPLYFNTKHWYPFGVTKTLLVILGVILMMVFYTAGLIVKNKISIKITPIHLIIAFFVFILTISSIFGIDPHNSFFGVFGFSANLIFVYAVSIFALLIGFLIRNNKDFLLKIVLTSFLSSIIVSFFSYTGTSFSKIFTDYSSTIGNSSYAGAYLLFNACFGIGLFFYYKKYWQKIFIAISTIFIMFCPLFFNINIFKGGVKLFEVIKNPVLILGVSNGAAIGLGLSVLFMVIFYFIFSQRKNFKILGIVLFSFIILSIFYVGVEFTNKNSSINRVYVESKGDNRFIAWDIAQKGFQDKPLLGNGFDNYSYNYQKYFTPDVFKNESSIEPYFYYPHNVIFQYASNNGILGLTSYVLLFFVSFILILKNNLFINKINEEKRTKILKISLMSALLGYFIQNLFVFDTTITYLMLFLVIGISSGLSIKYWEFEIPLKFRKLKNILSTICIVLYLFLMYIFVILPLKESLRWGEIAKVENLSKLIELRKNSQNISLFGGVEDSSILATEFYNFYLSNIEKIDNSNRKFLIDEIDSIINQLKNDIEVQPNNARSYLILGKLLSLKIMINGTFNEVLWNESKNNLDKSLELKPKNPETYLSFAQLYILKKDFNTTKLYIKQTILMVPQYRDSYRIAKIIQDLKPDADFQKFVEEMILKNEIKF